MTAISREVATLGALMIGAALGVAALQPGLANKLHASKDREDVYLFPPPEELKVATLGYHAAVVDMLWVKVRVDYGMHFVEKRAFPDLPHYFDAILAIEPDFAPVFHYTDTMICFHGDGPGSELEARQARAYLERGVKARPYDHDVWLHYGQFLAFMSASYLSKQEEIEQWRIEGAAALNRAVELGDDPERSLSAATLLNQRGERDAAVRALGRAYALTDDPKSREMIAHRLGQLKADDVRERAERDAQFMEKIWRERWPFVPRGTFLLFGPAPDPLACAGSRGGTPACSNEWDTVLPSSAP